MSLKFIIIYVIVLTSLKQALKCWKIIFLCLPAVIVQGHNAQY